MNVQACPWELTWVSTRWWLKNAAVSRWGQESLLYVRLKDQDLGNHLLELMVFAEEWGLLAGERYYSEDEQREGKFSALNHIQTVEKGLNDLTKFLFEWVSCLWSYVRNSSLTRICTSSMHVLHLFLSSECFKQIDRFASCVKHSPALFLSLSSTLWWNGLSDLRKFFADITPDNCDIGNAPLC